MASDRPATFPPAPRPEHVARILDDPDALPPTPLELATARITELEALLSQMREALRKMTHARDQALEMARKAEAGEKPSIYDFGGIAPDLAEDWPMKENLPPSSYGTP